jgi:hypothetical protein
MHPLRLEFVWKSLLLVILMRIERYSRISRSGWCGPELLCRISLEKLSSAPSGWGRCSRLGRWIAPGTLSFNPFPEATCHRYILRYITRLSSMQPKSKLWSLLSYYRQPVIKGCRPACVHHRCPFAKNRGGSADTCTGLLPEVALLAETVTNEASVRRISRVLWQRWP